MTSPASVRCLGFFRGFYFTRCFPQFPWYGQHKLFYDEPKSSLHDCTLPRYPMTFILIILEVNSRLANRYAFYMGAPAYTSMSHHFSPITTLHEPTDMWIWNDWPVNRHCLEAPPLPICSRLFSLSVCLILEKYTVNTTRLYLLWIPKKKKIKNKSWL